MPLTGHAFVGAATALLITPEIKLSRHYSPRTFTEWIPLNITLAYFPDITCELFSLAGWPEAKIISHSFLFALVAAFACTIISKYLSSAPALRRFFFFVTVLSLPDILDILQSLDRQPFWPLSNIIVSCPLIPGDPLSEGLLLLLFCIVVLAVFYGIRRPVISLHTKKTASNKSRYRTLFIIIALMLITTAIITQQMRTLREKQLDLARNYIAGNQFNKGLALLRQARRWPANIQPGRVEYLQGYILARTGKTQEAEKMYLRSWKKNPRYFWTVADLIILYAQQDISLANKQQLISPWYHHLLNDFPNHPDLPEYLDRLRQLLGKELSAIKDD